MQKRRTLPDGEAGHIPVAVARVRFAKKSAKKFVIGQKWDTTEALRRRQR